MKLLIVTQVIDLEHPILGFFHRWVEEFAKHFERIDIICFSHGTSNLPAHVHVHSLGKDRGYSKLRQLFRFYKLFGRCFFTEKPTYVFFHMGAIFNILAASFFLLRKGQGTKFYWWKTHGLLNLTGRLALHFVDRVLTAGTESFPQKSKKLSVVGHAIDTTVFIPAQNEQPKTFQALNEQQKTFQALVVGRVTPIKKIELALEALKGFVAGQQTAHLKIVGPANDASYLQKLQQLAADDVLRGTVTFTGPLVGDSLIREYQKSTVLLHPSYEAGFDKVVLEAMSAGVIPVTSIPSFRQVLERYGLFVPAKDVTGYIGVLQRVATMSRQEKTELAQQLRAEVVNRHSIETLPTRIFGV